MWQQSFTPLNNLWKKKLEINSKKIYRSDQRGLREGFFFVFPVPLRPPTGEAFVPSTFFFLLSLRDGEVNGFCDFTVGLQR